MSFAGFGAALGQAFMGYGQDQQQAFARQMQQNALARAMENEDFDKQLRLFQAGGRPDGDVATASQQTAQGASAPTVVPDAPAFNGPTPTRFMPPVPQAPVASPAPPSFGGPAFNVKGQSFHIDPNATPAALAEQRDAARQDAEQKRQQANAEATRAATDAATVKDRTDRFKALKVRYPQMPNEQAAAMAMDPTATRDALAVTEAATMTPYQQADLNLKAKGQASLDAYRKGMLAKSTQKPDKDQEQMQMAYTMAAPAVQQLTEWYGQDRNPGVIARTAGRLPVVGNAITGMADGDFQKAQQAAHSLAVQYLETQPKSRFQPNTVMMLEKLIAPEMGDTSDMRAQKLKTIQVFQKALQKRARVGSFSDLMPGADAAAQAPVPEGD